MKITLCNQKGGAGKTTLTMLLAMALARAGKKVGVIDLDSQETASHWLDLLDEENLVKVTDPKSSQDCDIVFFDTPPSLGDELAQALKQSDIAVIVSSPSPADVWSSQQTVEFVNKQAPEVKKGILFNKVEKGRKTSENLDKVAELLGVYQFKNTLPYYTAFQHAILDGWDALKSRDEKVVVNTALEIVTY